MRHLRASITVCSIIVLVGAASAPSAFRPVSVVHAASQSAVILEVSETVSAGNTMNIQGGGFSLAATATVQLIKSDGTPDPAQNRSMQIANQSPFLIQSVIPADMPAGLWAVRVINSDGEVSAPKYVHQARGNGYDNQEVTAGSTLRIWGRNMLQPGGTSATSYATFTAGSTVLTAVATAADAFSMTITMPSGVNIGTAYTVKVSNGLGGATGESVVPYPLTIRSGGPDPFALGVPWGADFTFSGNIYDVKTDSRLVLHAVGDGVTNDLPAIQAAIAFATNHGGGVVYFSAGTYILDNNASSLRVYPNVVLKGAGQANTTLAYNKNPVVGQYFVTIDDAGKIGFMDMTIQDLNTGTTQTGGMVTQYAAKSTEVFFKDITYNFAANAVSGLGCYCNKALMSGSTVTSKTNSGGPVGFSGSDIEFRNNSVTFGGGRNQFAGDNITIENNAIHRDGNYDYPQQHEDGALELSYSRNMHVLNNNIGIIGPHDDSDTAHGSNEQILTQNSVFNLGIFGTASAASPMTLTDISKDWTDPAVLHPQGYGPGKVNVDFFQNTTVAINSGTGIGQWRNVVSNDAHSVTVDRPWDISPDQTSGYVISRWTADRFQISGNTITNGIWGIILSSGANDSVVDGNMLSNTGGLGIWAWNDTDSNYPNAYNYLVWNNQITNNTLHDTSSAVGNAPLIMIGAAIAGSNGSLSGNVALNNEVRGNSVVANAPPAYTGNGPYDAPGYYNYNYWGGGSYVGADPIGIVGSIYESNTATNALARPYVSLGSAQNTAHYSGEPATLPCVSLKLADRPLNSQTTTGIDVKYFKTGTEELDARTENWSSQSDGTVVLNDPFLTGTQQGFWVDYPMRFRDTGTYDLWVKAAGFLAKKVPNITNVQTRCVSMPTGLLAGDFSLTGKNTLDITDISTWIRAFNGGIDDTAALANNAFGAPLTINSLGTMIRNFRTSPNGDIP